MPIPVIIITGFLGCGKTTLLRRLLPLCGELGKRPALIINEVGETDVDGELLADLHAEQVRLVGGCVCCTLQSQLSQTLYDVVEQQRYDIILLECSGLSNPIDVLSSLSAPALLPALGVSHVICVLDAARAKAMLTVTELAKQQVASSDFLVLNKEDRLDPQRANGVLALVQELAPQAELAWTSFGNLDTATCTRLLTDPAPTHQCCACDHHHDGHDHHDHAHRLPASFCTVALTLPDTLPRDQAEALLRALPDNVIRAKGFLHLTGEGWHAIHRVYDSIDLIPYTHAVPSTGPLLICIGQHLRAEELRGIVAGCGGLLA